MATTKPLDFWVQESRRLSAIIRACCSTKDAYRTLIDDLRAEKAIRAQAHVVDVYIEEVVHERLLPK